MEKSKMATFFGSRLPKLNFSLDKYGNRSRMNQLVMNMYVTASIQACIDYNIRYQAIKITSFLVTKDFLRTHQ
jgi:hypothetical protein